MREIIESLPPGIVKMPKNKAKFIESLLYAKSHYHLIVYSSQNSDKLEPLLSKNLFIFVLHKMSHMLELSRYLHKSI